MLIKQPKALEVPDSTPRSATSEWLQGTWLMNAKPEDISRLRCNSGTTDTYNPDGTTESFDYRGRWKLRRDRLTEKIVENATGGDPKVGTTWTVKIQRLGPHEGAIEDDNGWQPMLRCRPEDINR